MLSSYEYYSIYLKRMHRYILRFMLIYFLYIPINVAYSLAQTNTIPNGTQPEPTEVDDYLGYIEEECDTEPTINDPLESVNRLIFNANGGIDWLILKPAALLYNKCIPQYGRDRIGSLLRNLSEPLNFILNVLSFNIKGISVSSARFAINTVFGIAGMYDIAATRWNITNKITTGSDVLGKYGIPKGPYFILPILGPTSLRSAPGVVLGYYADPFNTLGPEQAIWTRGIATMIHYRAKMLSLTEEISKTSFDKYISTRSIYLQYQQYQTKK